MKKRLIEIYLDWVNNWLTLSKMAESYGIPPERLKRMVTIGKELHNRSAFKRKAINDNFWKDHIFVVGIKH